MRPLGIVRSTESREVPTNRDRDASLLAFQEARGNMALLLKGLAGVRVVEEGLRFEFSIEAPCPDLTELRDDEERRPDWLDQRLDPEAFP